MCPMSSKGRQRKHQKGGLESGVLNKQMSVWLIQELGAVCLSGCSSLCLWHFLFCVFCFVLFLAFFLLMAKWTWMLKNVHVHTHICSEVGKGEWRNVLAEVSFCVPHSRVDKAVLVKCLCGYRYILCLSVLMQSSKNFSELIGKLSWQFWSTDRHFKLLEKN